MAAISRPVSSQYESNSLVDSNFKCLRTTLDSIVQLCTALYYKIISMLSCLLCQEEESHSYSILGTYHYRRGNSAAVTYMDYGDNVIDYCINSVQHVREQLPEGDTELDALERIYGKATIQKWMHLGTRTMPLNTTRLSRVSVGSGGCCFGTSLDFISLFARSVKQGLSPLNAAKALSCRYKEGPPVEAQLLQIFGEALDLGIIDNEQTLNAKKTEVFKHLAHQFGLEIGQSYVYEKGDLARFVETLPAGHYMVTIAKQNSNGHAVAFIKSEKGLHFLQDQNRATFFMEENNPGRILAALVEERYLKGSPGTVKFFSCTLQS